LTAYSTTKHGIVGLSTSLRAEAAPHGVSVHVICPGPIETPLLDTHGPADLPDITGRLDPRKYLTSIAGGRAYSADALAADVLAGIAKGRPIIVAPRAAQLLRTLYRVTPGGFIAIAGRGSAPGRFTK
jgi:NAD(P)-dependent dehydrogenase (short-subunit alcohol dehydrogenase family)